jgi:hypothetical protein
VSYDFTGNVSPAASTITASASGQVCGSTISEEFSYGVEG